ncbi:MAG: radical SAM protein [Desulfobulbaceae bacterium]|nr:radical SAM protein [Desulfobulbaceae bacterium]HIJ89778.1 radical SAM protein [Deltaproteobacteria bacterium]
MKYVFGPVNSRRLGISQGIDLVPHKICNFNCIYCEIGATTTLTCTRREYIPLSELLAEIDTVLADRELLTHIDVFTITASGEPTLHSGIGQVIRYLKEKADKPVVVLTNGSLLFLPEVRHDLLEADIVIPSLDSAREESYRRINRPAACSPLAELIEGLIAFRKEFSGKLWLEILLASKINDSQEDIAALVEAVHKIRPDKVQLNTVARPPLESFANPLTQAELETVARQIPGVVEILIDFTTRDREKFRTVSEDEIIEMLKRRPCTTKDVSEALNLDPDTTQIMLQQLAACGRIIETTHHDKRYYQTSR